VKRDLVGCLNQEQKAIFNSLTSPARIQAFLDGLLYRVEDDTHCPLYIMSDKRAHCLDGALFAAAALSYLGHQPRLMDLLPEPGTDDDHVLAIYQIGGCYGAVAKSNYFTLRSREPVYRSLRELALSYFEFNFNINRERTQRYYSVPLELNQFDDLDWMCSDEHIPLIVHKLEQQHRFSLISPGQSSILSQVDELTYQAGMQGVNLAGVFKPRN
jgi:hypothetical protein